MNTSYGLDLYRSHDLNIAMKTSSGDLIKMDFANKQSSSIEHEENDKGSKTSMSFSSMQSFQFSIESNGIDKQDQKEIDSFMKIAQPFIDKFLKELEDAAPSSPVSQLAHKIAGIFDPSRDRGENEKNQVKTNIVGMFDNSLSKLKTPDSTSLKPTNNSIDDIFKQTKTLLEKTLEEFDQLNKKLYA